MGVTAILFPGQGSQTPDMRENVPEGRPDLLSLAVEVGPARVLTGLVKRTLKDVELAHA